MSYHSRSRTPLGLTAVAGGVILISVLLHRYDNERKDNSTYQDPRIDLINKLYLKSAGSDMVLDKVEKVKLLGGLGLESVIDESEVLSIVPSDNNDKLTVYLIAGKFERYLGNGQYGKVGDVEVKTAKEYLKTKK